MTGDFFAGEVELARVDGVVSAVLLEFETLCDFLSGVETTGDRLASA